MTEGMDPDDYKVHYASDDAGELGKLPVDAPGIAWIENTSYEYVEPKGSWNAKGEWKYK